LGDVAACLRILLVEVALVAGILLWRTFSGRKEEWAVVAGALFVNPSLPPATPQKEATAGSSVNAAFPAASGEFKLAFSGGSEQRRVKPP
jgi:hypothetical protein